MINRFVIALSLLAFVACKKSVQQMPAQPDPLFSVAYSINGNFQTLNAGKDGYYMYSKNENDEFNINQLIGELKTDDANQTNAFEFKFRSNAKTDLHLDSVLALGQKEVTDTNLLQASNTRIKLNLNALATNNVIKYIWSVNTNLSSTEKSPSFVFDSNEDNNFPVSLQTFFDTSCVATTKRCINFDNTTCHADFVFSKGTNLDYTFSVPASIAGEVSSVTWYINNQVAGTSKELLHSFSGAGNYLISADVFFNSGCMSCVSKRVIVDYGSVYNGCLSDFDVSYTAYNNAHFLQLNTTEINYWDDSGVLYSSIYSADPGFLEILEVSNFENNEVGKPTKKVRFSGNVRLTNLQGSELTVDIQEAIIAVGTGQ
jgi:hypothetical protein